MIKIRSVLVILFLMLACTQATAQTVPDSTSVVSGRLYRIIKYDGNQFIGHIITSDPKEVLIETKELGKVIIPKHEIKEMKQIDAQEVGANGKYQASETFATRYFVTTNGLPVKKGESYILFNWYGPDFQFGVGKNFGVGIMTSWIAMPVVASAKYSITLDANTHLAIGALLGTGSWAFPDFGIALPFAAITYGNRRNNITFSGGYGTVWADGTRSGRTLCSVAGMVKVAGKASLVFDSFILSGNGGDNSYSALYMPGIRLQTAPNRAFQFGFAGIVTGGNVIPVPMVQFFRML